MAGNFVESPTRLSKLIFMVLNFMTATIQGAWDRTSDDIINTRACNLLYNEAIHVPTETWTNSMRQKNISVEDAISWMTMVTVAC